MKVYDNYEISPCTRTEEPDSPGKFYFEVCEPHESDVWTLYGHIDGEGVQAISDFRTREHAAETYFRITGLAFTSSYQAEARLRVMHAGPKLLEALIAAESFIQGFEGDNLQEGIDDRLAGIRTAIAEAIGDSSAAPRKPIIIEIRGGVVQDVLNVPPGYAYEVKDYDDLNAAAEHSAGTPA